MIAFRLALLHFVWQGFAVALVLAAGLFLLRKRSAQSRYLLSCGAMAVMAILPAVTTAVLHEEPARILTGIVVQIYLMPGLHVQSPADWVELLQIWTLPVWSLGTLLFTLRLAWGLHQIARLKRSGEAAEAPLATMASAIAARMRVKKRVRLINSAGVNGPSVVGWIRPVILLPSAALLGLSTDQLETVLSHEFAHIRRNDYLINVLQTVVETLLFYHPAVWWISSRIRHERELCCDDAVVDSGVDAVRYARALTQLERWRLADTRLALSAARSPLQYRIERLLRVRPAVRQISSGPAVFAMCLAGVVFAMSGNSPQAKAQEIRPELAKQKAVAEPPAVKRPAPRRSVPVPQPAPPVPEEDPDLVVVDVTIDANGDALDARVVNGPLEFRKMFLQTALNAHIPGTGGIEHMKLAVRMPGACQQPPDIAALRTRLAGLSTRYTSLHPDVRLVRQQIELAEKALSAEPEPDGPKCSIKWLTTFSMPGPRRDPQ